MQLLAAYAFQNARCLGSYPVHIRSHVSSIGACILVRTRGRQVEVVTRVIYEADGRYRRKQLDSGWVGAHGSGSGHYVSVKCGADQVLVDSWGTRSIAASENAIRARRHQVIREYQVGGCRSDVHLKDVLGREGCVVIEG